MAIVVQDEVIFKVPGPYWRPPVFQPGVTSFGVVKVLFDLIQCNLILMLSCADIVPTMAIVPCFLVLATDFVRVKANDGDLAPLRRCSEVGWKGEQSHLVFDARS